MLSSRGLQKVFWLQRSSLDAKLGRFCSFYPGTLCWSFSQFFAERSQLLCDGSSQNASGDENVWQGKVIMNKVCFLQWFLASVSPHPCVPKLHKEWHFFLFCFSVEPRDAIFTNEKFYSWFQTHDSSSGLQFTRWSDFLFSSLVVEIKMSALWAGMPRKNLAWVISFLAQCACVWNHCRKATESKCCEKGGTECRHENVVGGKCNVPAATESSWYVAWNNNTFAVQRAVGAM